MTHFTSRISALGAMLTAISLTAVVGACSHSTKNETTPTQTTTATTSMAKPDNDGMTSMEIKESLRTVNTAYRYTMAGDTCFMTYTATIEWPEKIGGYNIRPLQDSIIAAAFSNSKVGDIKAAMKSFSTDTTDMGTTAVRISPADVPLSTRSYTSTVSAKAIDTGDRYSTYQVTCSSFTGGAHPNTGIQSMTYDYATQQVLTPANLFKAGSDSALVSIITENLAARLNVPENKLTQAGLFADTIPMPKNVYVVNNSLVFHYGQYEIAPYSSGMFDIDVSPFRVRDLLSPVGTALFKGYIE